MLILSIKDPLLRARHLQEGIVADLAKVKAIIKWLASTNVLEVRSFMGLAGYYRQFIKGFLKIENLITELQKKNQKFVWRSEERL